MARQPTSADRSERTTSRCPDCRGTGTVTAGERCARSDGGRRAAARTAPCPTCEGTGTRTTRRE